MRHEQRSGREQQRRRGAPGERRDRGGDRQASAASTGATSTRRRPRDRARAAARRATASTRPGRAASGQRRERGDAAPHHVAARGPWRSASTNSSIAGAHDLRSAAAGWPQRPPRLPGRPDFSLLSHRVDVRAHHASPRHSQRACLTAPPVRLPARDEPAPDRLTTRLLLLALFAVCSCGSDGGERHANPSPERSDAPADRGADTTDLGRRPPVYAASGRSTHATTPSREPGRSDARAAPSDQYGHTHGPRFSDQPAPAVRDGPGRTSHAQRTTPADGASTARLEWIGPASLVAPDADLRIEQDRLLVRLDAHHADGATSAARRGSRSTSAASCSRIRFCSQVTGVRGSSDSQTISLTAPAAGLRTYASSGAARLGDRPAGWDPLAALRRPAALRSCSQATGSCCEPRCRSGVRCFAGERGHRAGRRPATAGSDRLTGGRQSGFQAGVFRRRADQQHLGCAA